MDSRDECKYIWAELRCNIERPNPPLVEEEAIFKKKKHKWSYVRPNKNMVMGPEK
jgi:hypothetical protein